MPRNHPDQVEKRCFLGTQINRTGIEMFPCSYCKKFNRECVVSSEESSKRCSEYVALGRCCDVEGIPVRNWTTLQKEEDRLHSKRNTAFQQMEEAQHAFAQAQATNIAKICQLEKQQEFLQRRGKEMLRYGLQTLDELEAQEEKDIIREREEEVASTTIQLAATTAEQPNNPPGLSSEELLVFESSFWGLIAGSSETPPVSQGS
jgi:hypothetical protein